MRELASDWLGTWKGWNRREVSLVESGAGVGEQWGVFARDSFRRSENANVSGCLEAPFCTRLRRVNGLKTGCRGCLEMAAARLGKVAPQTSILFLCDMQEKFRPNISYFPQIVSVAARMLKVAKLLEIPTVVTEQYPKGLGPTVPELGAEDLPKYAKTCFSMLTPEVEKEMAAVPNLKSVLLCGIETQACIMRTALDVMERGLDVHVVADACSSRSQVDRIVALSRLRQSGAFLTTSEGLILQLVGDAAHPRFREIQKLIMDPAPDSGLLPHLTGLSPLSS